MTTKCAGLNCGTTTGNHSPECRAEHAAAVAGGRFVKDAGARWIAHWAGSNPYKGWSIRQGRDEVIWFGETISSETVEGIVLAHNKCFDCEGTGCVMNCSGLNNAASGQRLTEPTAFDFKSRLTAYGMLVRALRIVANTTLYEMGQALSLKPATLSAMEFGRVSVTAETVCDAAAFFESLGIEETLPALHAALRSDSATEGS